MRNKKENGEVVIEASLVVTIVMIFITIMLYIGMILYQQTLISVIANQTAANLAQIYSNNLKDPFTGYIDPDMIYQPITYNSVKTDAYMEVVKQKANVFAKYRLKSSSVLAAENTSVEVDMVKKPNELMKSQLVVTIRASYDVPLVSIFKVTGLVDFAATGRADCVDILEYINGVEAIGEPESSNILLLPNAENCTVTFIPVRSNPSASTSVKVLKNYSILSSSRYTRSVMPVNPTNGNLEFAGWVNETGITFTASTIVSENTVIYGSWNCDVKLDADGGKVNSGNTYAFKTRQGTRTYLPEARREGYQFKGWYTSKNGKGTRYLSNDTIIENSVVLYAYWECSHPSRQEVSRDGTVCNGGTIKYACTQCGADMGTGSYGGSGHNFSMRCTARHSINQFRGNVFGGCGALHQKNTYCSTCNVTHGNYVYAYCIICANCYEGKGYNALWCANEHCASRVNSRASHVPKDGKHNIG